MKYIVKNICGGMAHYRRLRDAIDAAGSWGQEPYVQSKRGARPVYDGLIGDYWQSYDELVVSVEGR